ncbi:MAG: HD-like signal output (HDOD) protein [Cognaticolwellia sp.]|jgi:HD-like signal output (HDOD) protein
MFAALKRMMGDTPTKLADVIGDAPLPSFPKVANQALDKLRDPNAALRDVGKLLERDPNMSICLLKTVNSAAFGLRRPCASLGHAASLLGRAQLEGLVLAVAVKSTSPERVPGINQTRFWKTAARRAAIARSIAAVVSPSLASEAFTAGLLQDLAVPLIAQRKKGYSEVLDAWHGGEGDLDDLERDRFGWDHAEIGGLLAKKWTFPKGLRQSISGHHSSHADAASGIVGLLHETVNDLDQLIEKAHVRYGISHDNVVLAIATGDAEAAELHALWA